FLFDFQFFSVNFGSVSVHVFPQTRFSVRFGFEPMLTLSLKSVHDAHRGPLPPVVIRELDFEKFQPLLKVQGKGKEKVSDEQVALDLLTLQKPKKVSPAEQYIF
nr:hypothetical protein [Tanacetum cinerariifolium]